LEHLNRRVELVGVVEALIENRVPERTAKFSQCDWSIFHQIERLYVNTAGRRDLGWQPKHDINRMLAEIVDAKLPRSITSQQTGSMGS
jgi:UDP-glucose 4-epimerase